MCRMSFGKLSDYAMQLREESKKRYLDKIAVLRGTDPYTLNLKTCNLALDSLPAITSETITDFLVFRVSPHTPAEVRAYKSLDGFVQFACKWIEEIKARVFNDYFCVLGKVMHSQRVNEPSLKVWIILSKKGEVVHCHCNCVAGLAEACTHVAAVLFALEYAGKQQQSVTDVLAYWLGPKSKKQFHKKIIDVDFKSPRKLLQSVKEHIYPVDIGLFIPDLTDAEISSFLTNYQNEGSSCALHALFQEEQSETIWPCLTNMYKEELGNKSLEELLLIAEGMDVVVPEEVIVKVEKETRQQAQSKLWFLLRAGRVTASNFGAVCKTRMEKSSLSLIKRICYPHLYKAIFRAGIYGCEHEKEALEMFQNIHKRKHACNVVRCGLILNTKWPWCAATPDAVLHCETCGTICIEIKCPFCAREKSIAEITEEGKGCLLQSETGSALNVNHQYFYQVQMQMVLSNCQAC